VKGIESYREDARGAGISEDIVESWLGLFRPSAEFEAKGDGPVAGQFGGDPMLPADIEWPAVSSELGTDEPIPLLASVDCAAIPPGSLDIPLPEDGHLLFFAYVDDYEYECLYRLLHVPAGTPTFPRASPPIDDSDKVRESYPLYYRPFHTLPEDPDPYDAGFREQDAANKDLARRFFEETAWQSRFARGKVSLGGHPSSWQTAHDGAGDDWVQLAQISLGPESTENIPTGDMYWMIRREDLAAGRYHRMDVYYQMLG
jgi:hypothetical protein